MQATLRPTEKRRLSRLLQVNRERTLTAAEDAEIDALLDRVNDVATERAAAMKLLQDRLVACPTCGALPTERGLWPRAK